MHLIERYATSCGVKIGKPFIYEKFFPLPIEKYISFQPFSKYNSKNYDFWQETLDIIIPYLSKENIKIVQIGTKNDRSFSNTAFVAGQTSIQQAAYIIRNSILHLGADSFGVHMASAYNRKIVAIYSNNNINNVKPYWTEDRDKVLISCNADKKPSYSAEESPKSINSIKPEDIAVGVLKLLNINYNKMPETVCLGQDYNLPSFEIVPEQGIVLSNILVENPIIRMDYVFNEEFIDQLLQFKKCIIFTNRPIKKDIIKKHKKNINQIIYIIDENNNVDFVKFLKKESVNYILLSFLPENILNKFKLNYLDYNLIINKKYKTKEDFNIKNVDNLYYKSSRILYGSKGRFISKYDWIHNTGNKVVDHPDFWKEADNFYIFKLT